MKTLGLVCALVLCFGPAWSQETQMNVAADCSAHFIGADKDGDGALDGPEIAASSYVVPAAVSAKAQVSKAEFLSACEGESETRSERSD